MLKVAITYGGDSKGLNGAALYVNRFDQIKTLFEKVGIQPLICDYNTISNRENDERTVRETEKAYAGSRIHAFKNFIKRVFSHTYLGSLLYIRFAWKNPALKAIKNNARAIEDADIILANDIYTAYYSIKLFPEKPIVFVMHNSGQLLKMLEDKLPLIKGKRAAYNLEKIEKEIFQKSRRIVFVSETARLYFCDMHRKYKDKTVYIPVGIENMEYVVDKPIKPLKFICVGTVCRRKNQIAIVDAMKNIDKTEATLTIVGHGDMLEECQKRAKLNNNDNIFFTGSVEKVEEYLDQASAFIIASLDEGLPAVGVEALRAGLPILTTNVGGCAELVRNENGIVISDTSSNAIYKEMYALIKRKDQIKTMSQKSRQLYEDEYSLSTMVKKYKEILEE